MIYSIDDELELFVNTVDLSRFADKKIMITGASGLIASYMVDVIMKYNEMKSSEIHIYAVVRNVENAKIRFLKYEKSSLFDIVDQDISEENNFDFAVDYVIHAASNANPVAFDSDPIGTIKANVNGTLFLLDYAKRVRAEKFLYISSTEIYGETVKDIQKFSESDMGTIDPMKPRSCYTESKRMAENICVNYSKQFSVATSIVRVGYAYGPTYTKSDSRVIPQFIGNAIKGENIVMKSNGDLVRSYIYTFDVVSALFKVLESGLDAEVYNVANKKSDVSIRDIAETVAQASGTTVEFKLSIEDQTRGYSPFSMGLIDATKLEKLGWKPRFNLDEGIRNIVIIKSQNI